MSPLVIDLSGGVLLGLLLGWLLNLLVEAVSGGHKSAESASAQVDSTGTPKGLEEEWQKPAKLFRRIVLFGLLPLMVCVQTAWRHWGPELLSDIILSASLSGIAVVDWENLFIEIRMLTAAMLLRVLWLIVFHPGLLLDSLTGLFVGAGLLYLLGVVYEAVRNRQGLGEGDPAVLGLIGLWVGWQGLGPVLLVAALSGTVFGGLWLLRHRRPLLHSPVPFGPFLCLGGLLVHLLQQGSWMPGLYQTLWF